MTNNLTWTGVLKKENTFLLIDAVDARTFVDMCISPQVASTMTCEDPEYAFVVPTTWPECALLGRSGGVIQTKENTFVVVSESKIICSARMGVGSALHLLRSARWEHSCVPKLRQAWTQSAYFQPVDKLWFIQQWLDPKTWHDMERDNPYSGNGNCAYGTFMLPVAVLQSSVGGVCVPCDYEQDALTACTIHKRPFYNKNCSMQQSMTADMVCGDCSPALEGTAQLLQQGGTLYEQWFTSTARQSVSESSSGDNKWGSVKCRYTFFCAC